MSAKTLILVRHAKSSWKDESLADIDRPLNKRGQRDAPEMGRRLAVSLKQAGHVPDLLLCSTAVRACLTATCLAEALGFSENDITISDELYGAHAEDILQQVRAFPADISCAIVVGHNPTMTDLANQFSKTEIDNVPTCGILTVQMADWLHVSDGWLTDFDFPKKPVDSV